MSNPFLTGNIDNIADTNNELPIFIEYAWDFINNHFLLDTKGNYKIVKENEAMKVWIYKTLKTERWRYLVYDNSYGIELEKFIGAYINNNASNDEIKQYIIEALSVNPYIKTIDRIDATINNDTLIYEIELSTIYGKLKVDNKS